MIATPETKLNDTKSHEAKLPRLLMQLPGPKAKHVVEQDARFMSPSFTRDYPLVAKRGHGAIVEDVDGNTFLDFAAGIAVCSTGHCHPKVVAAIQEQARREPFTCPAPTSITNPFHNSRKNSSTPFPAPTRKSLLHQLRHRKPSKAP